MIEYNTLVTIIALAYSRAIFVFLFFLYDRLDSSADSHIQGCVLHD